MRTILVFTMLAAVGVLTALNAQAPSKPPDTIAELRLQIATLERDLAGLQKDYQLLLATCRQPPIAPETTPSGNVAPPGDSEPQADPWFVNGTDYTVTEDNLLYTRYGWTITITNADNKPRSFDINAEFVDEQGIVVRTARLFRTTVEAIGQRTFGSDTRIDKPAALRVVDVQITAIPR